MLRGANFIEIYPHPNKKSSLVFTRAMGFNYLMTKYKEYFNRMVAENKEAFDEFTRAHFEYSTDQDKNQEMFNREGEKINKIIHEWEDRLCKQSEKAGFGSYTTNLAEKFQEEVRSHFPLIDSVGIVVNKFNLKKIKLN
jgi:hypothetical protein